jgi:hypothetical protein
LGNQSHSTVALRLECGQRGLAGFRVDPVPPEPECDRRVTQASLGERRSPGMGKPFIVEDSVPAQCRNRFVALGPADALSRESVPDRLLRVIAPREHT